MNSALVGYTGFVGTNLAKSHNFNAVYNSKNINEAIGTRPDLLIYSGVPAAKYLANVSPEKDLQICENAAENIAGINAKTTVLISTVDVYENPNNADENTEICANNSEAYGRNRAILEKIVQEQDENVIILRLPALFGEGLKKNFLYDFLTLTPSMLKPQLYEELSQKSELVKCSYSIADNGFYCLTNEAKTTNKQNLKQFFKQNNFNALSFTDSRAVYQFYNLENLYADIIKAIENNIKLLNIATQPLSVSTIYESLTNGESFVNEIAEKPAFYDFKSIHYEIFGGENGYLYSADAMLLQIANFAKNAKL